MLLGCWCILKKSNFFFCLTAAHWMVCFICPLTWIYVYCYCWCRLLSNVLCTTYRIVPSSLLICIYDKRVHGGGDVHLSLHHINAVLDCVVLLLLHFAYIVVYVATFFRYKSLWGYPEDISLHSVTFNNQHIHPSKKKNRKQNGFLQGLNYAFTTELRFEKVCLFDEKKICDDIKI